MKNVSTQERYRPAGTTRLSSCRNVPEMEIASIQFGLLPPEVMKRASVANITRPELPEEQTSKAMGTLFDPRMGPFVPGRVCVTCGKTISEGCLGHFGYIDLKEPVVNPLLLDAVIDTLNAIDHGYGKILPFPELKAYRYKRALRSLRKELRELEENFYSRKITENEFFERYREIHAKIEETENAIIELVRAAREEYIAKAREYLERHNKAPIKFVRELKKQRERYVKTMTPMVECPSGHKFYRLGHKTPKRGRKESEVVCPICGARIPESELKRRVGVRSPYGDELIKIYKVVRPRDSLDVSFVYIDVSPKILRESKGRKKRISVEEVVVPGEEETVLGRRIKEILARLSVGDSLGDAAALGRHPENSRPVRAMLEGLLVVPNQLRAKMILPQGQSAEHPYNELYRGVVSAAMQHKQTKASKPRTFQQMYSNLVRAVRALFHLRGPVKGTSKNVKGLGASLRGKKGLFRRYLTGKRVDFSARSVISPDPFLSINEVGVPVEVAMKLTVEEVANEYNAEKLKRLVLNGPENYPGAKYAIYVDPDRTVKKYDLSIPKKREEVAGLLERIAKGEDIEEASHIVIERHMLDGDPVLFNRQPSLHRMSMMAFRARVLPYRTFRMNLAVCPPFNADFDGDEMNLHQLQLPEARIEAEELMLAEKHIMTPRYGAPIIGGNEDHITAMAMASYAGSRVPKHIARHLLGFVGYDGEYPEGEEILMRDAFSLLIPRKIHMRKRSRLCDAVFRHRCVYYQKLGECPIELYEKLGPEAFKEYLRKRIEDLKKIGVNTKALEGLLERKPGCDFDVYTEIKAGRIVSGMLDKFAVGAETEFTIIHHIVRRYGVKKAGEFIDKAFRMALKFLTYNGFTVSAKDFDIPDEAFRIIKEVFDEYDERIKKLYDDYREGRLVADIGLTLEETFKTKLRRLLDELRDRAAEALIKYIIDRGLVFENNVLIMTGIKARGDITQFAQMMVTVGAMTVRGQFISRGFSGRTLPHFKPGLLEPRAMGFVRSSFRLGMDPIEYFFQAAAGRDGLIDTATKTSDSGYLQRKMIHNLEDLVVEYDGTVRTLYGDIVQFLYGEDGLDVTKTDYGKIDVERIIQELIDDVENGIPVGLLKKKVAAVMKHDRGARIAPEAF